MVAHIILWHQVDTLLPYIVTAVQKTFERGIGQGLQAKLRKVFAETFETEEAVFDSDEGLVLRKLPHVSIGQVMAVVHPVKVLTVRFITSLALIFQANCKTP